MAQAERELRLNWFPRPDGQRGPSARQAEFLRCGAREQLYGGSKRGGKTVAGAAKAIALSVMYPGNRGLIARQAFTDLRDSTLVSLFTLCPPELIHEHNRSSHRILLRTTKAGVYSEIIYRGLGEDSDSGLSSQKAKEKSKGIECGWVWVDEPSEVSFESYRMMLAQLCWILPDGTRPPYMALLTSNPEPGWVKDRFVDPDHPDYIVGKADARFIPSLPSDNPGLPPGWEADLRATMDPEWVRRYLEGSWDLFEGQVFTELSDKLHNLDNYVDPRDGRLWSEFWKGFRIIGSLDHASTGITAYLLVGIDWDENAFALEEYYCSDKRIVEHAEAIRSLEARYGGRPEYRLIDPSTEAKTLQNAREMFSVQDAYVREGLPTVAAHRAQIAVGIDLLKEYLHCNQLHRNPFTQEHGAPRLFISKSRCPNLWREMAGLKREPKPDGSLVFVGSDHAIDDLRYILMSRPPAAARKNTDLEFMAPQERHFHVAHQKWADKFARPQNTGSWF